MVVHFVSQRDVFISLPTAYRKIICFSVLPWTFNELRGERRKCIIVVVSLLNALIESQVTAYRGKAMTVPAEVESIMGGLC